MKVLLDKYPKGTLPYQKSDGRYIDTNLYTNLEVLAENIIKDMTFMGVIFSSTLEVGTGKSVIATQIGEVYSELVEKKHGVKLNYGVDNIVWRPSDLIERAFQVPKYSFILLDEWEDAHYWSKMGMTLRQFFRKCRQLNLFIMIIIPNWFQLPMNYAIGRSIFAIDVKFGENFERGHFDFYDFGKKRKLFIEGKKTQNYYVAKPSFKGDFTDGYGVDEKEYRLRKKKDMEEWDEEKDKKVNPTEIQYDILYQIYLEAQKKQIPLTHEFFSKVLNKTRQAVSQAFDTRRKNEEKKPKKIVFTRDSAATSKEQETYYNSGGTYHHTSEQITT